MMDTEAAIYAEFKDGDLALFDAIERLQKIGYEPKEAERIADEWADGLEAEHEPH